MKYPINEDKFVEICLKYTEEADEYDALYARELVNALNRAYRAGLEDGKKQRIE